MNEPVEGCSRCFIENKACAEHCDPNTCTDRSHFELVGS